MAEIDRKRLVLAQVPECGHPACNERAALRGGEQGIVTTIAGVLAVQTWTFLCAEHARQFAGLVGAKR